MSGALRPCWRAAAAALVAAALAGGVQAAPAPVKGPVLVLRGPQTPDKPQAARPAALPGRPATDPGSGPPPLADLSPVPRFQDQPAPRFSLDPAPRIQGLDLRGGGAQCRTACAETRYQCRLADEADVCDGAWGQCVANCPEGSSSPL